MIAEEHNKLRAAPTMQSMLATTSFCTRGGVQPGVMHPSEASRVFNFVGLRSQHRLRTYTSRKLLMR